jgi:hypothetical protein
MPDTPIVPAAVVKNAPDLRADVPVLLYIGSSASIPDVPARDLTDADLAAVADLSGSDKVAISAALISSNLYKGV